MSCSLFGSIEFKFNLDDAKRSYPLTFTLVKEALFNDVYFELQHSISDKYCNEILAKIRAGNSTHSERTLDFWLTDSPIAPDSHELMMDFVDSNERNEVQKSKIYKFLDKLWTNPSVEKVIIVFGWAICSFNELELPKTGSLEDLVRELWDNYIKTNSEPNCIFVLDKN